MITIPLLNRRDLDIFKGKRVLLYGLKDNPLILFKILKLLGIEVIGHCSEGPLSNIEIIREKFAGLRYIKRTHLAKYVHKYDNVIVLILTAEKEKITELESIAVGLGLECSNIQAGNIVHSFGYLTALHELNSPVRYIYRKFHLKDFWLKWRSCDWKAFQNSQHQNPVVICSPTKTGDFSINYTFDAVNQSFSSNTAVNKINYINLWHAPSLIDRKLCEKKLGTLKIIVGMREPISQNLSSLYQEVVAGTYIKACVLGDLDNNFNKKDIAEKYMTFSQENSGNVQLIWDAYINVYMHSDQNCEGLVSPEGLIQSYFSKFEKQLFDITKYPFDKERGYGIIKEGNTEIFLYQLEKLNNLAAELSQWVGVPFDKLEKGNDASDKWIANSYKQAQKDIEISQEYFDKCFNEPYVKHCYSEEDIEKFKEKWRPHIKR